MISDVVARNNISGFQSVINDSGKIILGFSDSSTLLVSSLDVTTPTNDSDNMRYYFVVSANVDLSSVSDRNLVSVEIQALDPYTEVDVSMWKENTNIDLSGYDTLQITIEFEHSYDYVGSNP